MRSPTTTAINRKRRSRSFNDVAADLLVREPRLVSTTVRAWLTEVAAAEVISLMDGAVLRAMARACGVAEW